MPTSRKAKDPLTTYRRKRDFGKTPEPSGRRATGRAKDGLRFVVQRHRASRLHYDFRLEVDGVLVSWAVPKGPTLDPGVRRAAFHVEDHPMEYLEFEGVIPADEYGGGDVIVWDTGTWEPVDAGDPPDPAKALEDGELKADLHGEKLKGRFVFVKTRGGIRGRRAGSDDWLLLHKRDEFAEKGWDPEQHPQSVLSGRTNEEVKENPDRMWRSDLPPAEAEVDLRTSPDGRRRGGARATRGARATGKATGRAAAPAADSDELAEALDRLDAMKASGTWHVYGRDVKVTNLDKVLFPGKGRQRPITKRELLRYAARIAPTALPYFAGRPLNLHRYPDGAGTAGFWQKEVPSHAPDWLGRWDNPDANPGETKTYMVVDEPAAMVWIANFGGIEWHPWSSKVDKPQKPTWALIDLDPGRKTSWADLVTITKLHKDALDHLGVRAGAKVTGKRGIQIWIPITRGIGYEASRAWVEKLSRSIGDVVPDLVSWKWQKADRAGLARLDYTQNAVGNTLVAPYSPRPANGAPVSAPIAWEELDDKTLKPDGFTIRTVFDRLDEHGDLFRDLLDVKQRLPKL